MDPIDVFLQIGELQQAARRYHRLADLCAIIGISALIIAPSLAALHKVWHTSVVFALAAICTIIYRWCMARESYCKDMALSQAVVLRELVRGEMPISQRLALQKVFERAEV